jgi:sterol desaturase/sphingolipid hydroxylase (fatty acid hydroxylase superfamily)
MTQEYENRFLMSSQKIKKSKNRTKRFAIARNKKPKKEHENHKKTTQSQVEKLLLFSLCAPGGVLVLLLIMFWNRWWGFARIRAMPYWIALFCLPVLLTT